MSGEALRERRFAVFAFAFRYPGEDVLEPLPSQQQVDAWVDEIATLRRDFERWLAARAGAAEDGEADGP